MDNRADVTQFIQQMVKEHHFNQRQLSKQFASIRSNPKVLQFIRPPASPTQRSWERYQPRFINPVRIDAGVKFWNAHEATLAKAEREYGVPAEIIVGIIGVETIYGRHMGSFKTLEALATLAFDYPPRADFFRSELEQFLLLSRENRIDPLSVKGSFAGAIGIPQFMPGSQRRYAVDFDHDGKVDLHHSIDDAIGSVARFLSLHGWVKNQPIATPVQAHQIIEPSWLESGIWPRLKLQDLLNAGIQTRPLADVVENCALVDLVTPDQPTEYWLGFENFYVITRYNRSSFYAMSVFQLAEAVRQQRLL